MFSKPWWPRERKKIDLNLINSTQQNETGPGALTPPDAGLGRRGHLERRRRRDARTRGAGVGKEGALRCVIEKWRGEEREGERGREARGREGVTSTTTPFSSSSLLPPRLLFILSHRGPTFLYTSFSLYHIPITFVPRSREKTTVNLEKPFFYQNEQKFFFLLFCLKKETRTSRFLSKVVAARPGEVLCFSRSCSSPVYLEPCGCSPRQQQRQRRRRRRALLQVRASAPALARSDVSELEAFPSPLPVDSDQTTAAFSLP